VVARRKFPKRAKAQHFRTKNPENPENGDITPERLARRWMAFKMQRFRNSTLSSFIPLSFASGLQ